MTQQQDNNHDLETLLKIYQDAPTQAHLMGLIACIKTKKLYIPIKKVQPLIPTILLDSKTRLLPLFTSIDQIPENLRSQQMLNMPFLECIRFYKGLKQPISLVLNPYTNNMVFTQKAIALFSGEEGDFCF